MIGRINGILLEKQAPQLLIDVQGIGYEVLVSMNTFFDLPLIGENVTLHTHFVVREDIQQLYGFVDHRERELFRALVKISGVGPKMALAILSGMTADEFVLCVQTDNAAALVKLPGVGKKTAERLLIEMRDRIKDWQGGGDLPSVSIEQIPAMGVFQEAESALVSLGYKPQEASRMVSAVATDNASSEDLIRMALKTLVKK
ncbi:MAG: Holliday junction branch migration protein RuvA [Porticoccaceae bacterium]|nr:Holliday junction branch migration protein RuvA [Pseudomonadales bacterium]MCP5173222.1 Holliday junction branch migration protein RuvA [Pseudomonadales bacterium]